MPQKTVELACEVEVDVFGMFKSSAAPGLARSTVPDEKGIDVVAYRSFETLILSAPEVMFAP